MCIDHRRELLADTIEEANRGTWLVRTVLAFASLQRSRSLLAVCSEFAEWERKECAPFLPVLLLFHLRFFARSAIGKWYVSNDAVSVRIAL